MTLIPNERLSSWPGRDEGVWDPMVVLWLAAKSSGEMETLTTQLLT
jgi:hypothetical protein